MEYPQKYIINSLTGKKSTKTFEHAVSFLSTVIVTE